MKSIYKKMINKHLGVKIGLTAVLTAAGLQVFQSMGEGGVGVCLKGSYVTNQALGAFGTLILS